MDFPAALDEKERELRLLPSLTAVLQLVSLCCDAVEHFDRLRSQKYLIYLGKLQRVLQQKTVESLLRSPKKTLRLPRRSFRHIQFDLLEEEYFAKIEEVLARNFEELTAAITDLTVDCQVKLRYVQGSEAAVLCAARDRAIHAVRQATAQANAAARAALKQQFTF